MKKTYFFLFAFWIAATFVLAQDKKYEGNIGGQPIFLTLDLHEDYDFANAAYFFTANLRRIPLSGTHGKDEVRLTESFPGNRDSAEHFTLKRKGENWEGIWQKNGITKPIFLRPTSQDLVAYKRSKISFLRDSIFTFPDGRQLVWFSEKYSKQAHFRLGNGFSTSQREFINPRLDSLHVENILTDLDCGWAEFHLKIEHLTDRYFSFSETSNTFCGGAHPNYGHSGYNFDLRKHVEIKELTEVYPDLNLYPLLKAKYQNDTNLDEECAYFDDRLGRFDYYSWVFTPEGVEITPHLAHAATPCEIGFLLTYEELENH